MRKDKYILKNLSTPYYIIEEEKLNNNLENLKKSFEKEYGDNIIYSYSFKTNSLPWILDWFRKKSLYAEVVSEPEYNLAIKLGYNKEKIIFNGPFKGFTALEKALNDGAIVNLDSFHEIDWIKNNRPKDKNGCWKIGLRINFDLEKYCPNETIMGKESGRFGFNIENKSFEKAIKELSKLSYVKIVGLHGHNSTKTKSLEIFKIITLKLVEASFLINNKIDYLDIGGCLFGDKPGAPTFTDYAKIITNEITKKYKKNEITLILEPGAALIASPITYVCKIIDSKEINNKIFLSVDGSLHHINPAMSGIKFNINFEESNLEKIEEQIVGGYTCIEKDRLGIIKNSNKLEVNSYININNVGAYSMALSPLFIQYYPDVYVLKNNKYYLAREKWNIEDYMNKSTLGYEKIIKE